MLMKLQGKGLRSVFSIEKAGELDILLISPWLVSISKQRSIIISSKPY